MVYKAKKNMNIRIIEIVEIEKVKHENYCDLYDYFYTKTGDNPEEEYLNLILEYIPQILQSKLISFSK